MTYKLTPEMAELAKNQLAKNAGWVLVYHADEISREYTGASYEYILKNVGLSAHSYSDPPTLPAPGYAIIRSADGKRWEHVRDHRGKTAVDIYTREQRTVIDMGELPEHLTLSIPPTEFDIWDGENWVTDDAAKIQAQRQTAQQTWQTKLHEANEHIQILNDVLELTIATAEEIARLAEWKRYRVKLSRINIIQPTEIVWPQQPVQLNK